MQSKSEAVTQSQTVQPPPLFKSGAASSKCPRFDYIPRQALIRVAQRFELGVKNLGDRAWNATSANQAPLTDREFVIARATHAIDHATKLIDKLIKGEHLIDIDDDAAAIAWAGLFLCEATYAITEESKRKADMAGKSTASSGVWVDADSPTDLKDSFADLIVKLREFKKDHASALKTATTPVQQYYVRFDKRKRRWVKCQASDKGAKAVAHKRKS